MTTDVVTPDKVKTCPSCGATSGHRQNRSWYCTPCYDARYGKTPCPECSRPMKIGSVKCAECRWGGAELKDMTGEQVAWLAGILEGEGSFLVRGHRAVAVQVVMTDRDIIDRLVLVTGVGRINGYKPAKPHYKQAWVWHVRRRAHVIPVVNAVMPWLGERRTVAAQRVLDELAKPLLPRKESNLQTVALTARRSAY
jgi:ssDNA-binding Zn-finger/Zn-ribbon topoisomerase 1